MANTKSAQKRNRQALKRRARNQAVRTQVKSAVKRAREALAALGWRVETIWECDLKDAEALRARLGDLLAVQPPTPTPGRNSRTGRSGWPQSRAVPNPSVGRSGRRGLMDSGIGKPVIRLIGALFIC